MEKEFKQLTDSGITVKQFTCDYMYIRTPKPYLILSKFHGYELIPPEPDSVKYFRTISELIEYVKK